MIIKSGKKLPLRTADQKIKLPVLPIRTGIIFPGETQTIQVGRRENLELLKVLTDSDNLVVLSFVPQQKDAPRKDNVCQVGVIARVSQVKPAMGNSRMVTLEGLRRVALANIVRRTPYLQAEIAEVDEKTGGKKAQAGPINRIIDKVKDLIQVDNRYTNEVIYTLKMNKSNPWQFADRVASMINFQLDDKQEVLEAINIQKRLETLIRLLDVQVENVSLAIQIKGRVDKSLETKRRELFLRQQLMEIRRELGEDFVEEDVAKVFHKRIKEHTSLPREVADQLQLEANRLKHLSSSSTEYGSTKSYIDLLLSLPWDGTHAGEYDLGKVEKAIDQQYYGSAKIKSQILEFLAVRQSARDERNQSILCLAGPVGTGKASLIKAITKATGRKLVRFNGNSLIMVEDIKGTRRSEIGSGPGQLVRAIQREQTLDLVVYIEDVEYIIESEDSNALLALMEAVDPRHNTHFIDNFLGVPLDFSRIMFVLGLSNADEFPEPFGHRLELMEMPGYIDGEKIVIAKKHILPKLYRRHDLKRSELKFTEKGLARIIRYYTMEAGLIDFQQKLEHIFRKVNRRKATSRKCCYSINDKSLDQFLGPPPFVPEKATAKPEIGVATGLAWTGAGGDLMLIEGLKMRGTGQVIYTGSLGEIMKESIQAAHSFVRARAETLGIDHSDFVNFDIHIHFPMGAIPKDGPSAGVTVSLVIASVMAERPIRNDIAMTGEVTLRGKVLSVGGVKEKVAAAYRAGIYTILLPKENEKDLKYLPKEILNKTKFIYIETIDELFEHALMEFTPSSYTLEKIFAEEIEKAKKRNRTKGRKKKEKSSVTRKVARKSPK